MNLSETASRTDLHTYDCFICYRRGAGLFPAKMVRDQLENMGRSCFLNPDEVQESRMSRLDYQAMVHSSIVVVILTGNSLDWCTIPEDPFATEIETARRLGKKIVPVRIEGFTWPTHLEDELPDAICALNDPDAVTLTADLFEAGLKKLFSPLVLETRAAKIKGMDVFRNRSVRFFVRSFNDPDEIESIDMAFHAGSYWSRTTEKVYLMNYLLSHGVKIRILFNPEEVIEPIVRHMRVPLKRYLPLSDNEAEWAQMAAIYPDLIEVRVANKPLLHRIYLCRLKNGTGSVSIKNYRYGDASSDEENWIAHEDPKASYKGYCEEFDYIWEHLSEPIGAPITEF